MIEVWAVFSILAAFLWAVSNVIDKYVFSKLVSKPIIPMIISGFVALAIGLFVLLFHGFGNLNFWQLLLVLIAGAVYIFMLLLYFKAIKIGEISTLIPLFYLVPLFIAVIAWFLLGERLALLKYVGIALLIVGAFLVSWDNKNHFKFGKAFWLMIVATFLLAINQVITKYLLNFSDSWTVLAYVNIGCFFSGNSFIYKKFPRFKRAGDKK
jgi:bacterial/archaeal transporter family protein